jgi:hypothetical protein
VTSSIVCDITFELARHEFQRNFYVLRDVRVDDLVLDLPWLDDEHASLQFGTTRIFALEQRWRRKSTSDAMSVCVNII